ncbi:MAG: PQQ-like beta-propeller repeat protein [Phycisphaeraceae bacterium]|nr:PQQ-like beta-propeller repeat protein [Phycisphaeraceae bacterium]
MKRDRVTGIAVLFSMLLSTGVFATDWPNWRGPNYDGTTTGEGFDPAFAKGGTDIRWSADIGVGFTGVTVAEGKAYTAGWKNGDTTFYAFDTKTGKKAWSHSFPTKKYDNLNVGGPSGTAAVNEGKVYHMARDGQFFCYDAGSGDIVWKKNLAKAYGVEVPRWGFSGSPLILDDTLYLDIGKIIALDKATGKEQWVTKDYGPAYSTPALITLKGKDYLAVFPATGLYVIERDGGKQVAHQPWKTDYDVHAATPVVVGDKILMSSEYNNGCALMKFTGKGLEMLWDNRNLRQKMGTSVYYKGHFYGFNSTKLTCVNAETGKEMWDQRGLGHGNVIIAGDTLVVLSDRGEVLTAPASPNAFRPITKTQVIKGDKTIWTAPTLANNQLYVRGSRGKLVCIDVSK